MQSHSRTCFGGNRGSSKNGSYFGDSEARLKRTWRVTRKECKFIVEGISLLGFEREDAERVRWLGYCGDGGVKNALRLIAGADSVI